jgi:polyphosphate kinase 2 (PPK2 family)
LKRFHDRRHDPLKTWKLSPVDLEALNKWDDYSRARDTMLKRTDSNHAPWTVIRANDKKRTRLNVIRTLLNGLIMTARTKARSARLTARSSSAPRNFWS